MPKKKIEATKSEKLALPLKPKSRIIFSVVVLLILALLFFSKSLFIAAVVNGKPVFRFSVIRDLEKRSGKAALEAKVAKVLIFQEAAKQNIVITPQEVESEIAKIESSLASQNQNLNKLLALDGISHDEFVEQIKIQKIAQRILGDKTQVTEEEIQTFLDQNKSSIPKDQEQGVVKENIKTQLANQKLNSAYGKWMEELKTKAKINYFVNY